MEFLISLLAGVAGFVGGIVGNIMAHDLCNSAQRVCERIVRRAARRLGDEEPQKRYEEEWLADLAERDTVNAKYRHAIGCYFSSGKIKHESRKVYLYVIYFIPRYGKVLVKFNISSRFLFPIWFLLMTPKWNGLFKCATWAGIGYYLYKVMRCAHAEQPGRLPQLIDVAGEALRDKTIKDWPFNVKLTRNGMSWNVTEIAHTCLKDPRAILVLKNKLGTASPRKVAEMITGIREKPKNLA